MAMWPLLFRGGAVLVHGIQMRNAAQKISM
jgi:hypothetical protein